MTIKSMIDGTVEEAMPKPSIQELSVHLMRLDGGTQARQRLSAEAIEDYAKHLDELPPVVVFFDGEDYWLADGFQRFHAHLEAKRATIRCDVRKGTRRDAILYAVGANATHGLRRSNEDKRQAVLMLLKDQEWGERSDRWIAEKCRVSNHLVAEARASTGNSPSSKPPKRKGRDGKARKAPKKKTKPARPAPESASSESVENEAAHDQAAVEEPQRPAPEHVIDPSPAPPGATDTPEAARQHDQCTPAETAPASTPVTAPVHVVEQPAPDEDDAPWPAKESRQDRLRRTPAAQVIKDTQAMVREIQAELKKSMAAMSKSFLMERADRVAEALTCLPTEPAVGALVTLAKCGSEVRTVHINDVEIPDLWHIGRALGKLDKESQEAVWRVWHIAHDLKRHIQSAAGVAPASTPSSSV
jgi:hypothetical protein